MKIHKGDTVKVRLGKDAGKTGKVLKIDSQKLSVLVEGLNLFKKHVRPKKQGEKGQVVALPRPLNISKVMLICPSCKEPSRVGYRVDADGKAKTRYCKNCGGTV